MVETGSTHFTAKHKDALSQQQIPTAMEEHRVFFSVVSYALRTLRERFLVYIIGKVLRIIMANGFGVVISFLCPPRPKTYSWTAAFLLRAPFTVGKAGVGA